MAEVTPPTFGYPHMTTLAYGIPFSGRPLPPQLLLAFSQMSPPMNTNVIMFQTMGRNIDEARTYFAEKAIEHKAKYLLFWDEDVLVPAHALRELMFFMEHHPEAALCGAIYCLKVPHHPEPLVFKTPGAGPSWDWKVGEIFEVGGIGMGLCLIRVDMFKDLKKPWFKTVNDLSPFLDNIPYGEVWTEDLWFCKQIREAKQWKMFAHGQLICPHLDVTTGKAYELSPDSKPMKGLTAPRGKLKILDIGSGEQPYHSQEGKTITLDMREEVHPDYRCDGRKLPFATGEFDIVHSAHTLEHFDRGEVGAVLDEWLRVLKPDTGELRLNIPNLEWAAQQILKGTIDHNVLNVLYGEQTYDLNFHRCGFTPKTLAALLTERGWGTQTTRIIGYNIMLSAKKGPPDGVDRQPRAAKNARRRARR